MNPVVPQVKINLAPFLSRDETRPNIMRPWKVRNWVYATDGRIIVRVPEHLYSDVKENPEAPKAPSECTEGFPWVHDTLSPWVQPSKQMLDCHHPTCAACNGTGEHLCAPCDQFHDCAPCNGIGFLNSTYAVPFQGVRICSLYCYYISLLPNPELHIPNPTETEGLQLKAIPFRFDGGWGYVMPMR